MSCKKTITVVLAIIFASAVILCLNYSGVAYGAKFLPDDTGREMSLLMNLFIPLIAGLLFCSVAYLMLIWDAGDKIPPLVMGGLGFLSLFVFFIFLLSPPLFIYDLVSPLVWSPIHHMMTGLYIALGVLGLFTKRKLV